MSRLVEAKRTIGLLVVLMAAVVVLSGPVAEVLDLPAPTAEAKNKHKHKKKKHKKNRPPAFNVVQCPTEEDGIACQGTAANDFLIGGPEDREPFGAFDVIFGGEGNDVYNGGNGSDNLDDSSTTSSDVYIFPVTEFSAEGEFDEVKFAEVRDEGGSGDIVGLNSYSIDDFLVFQIVGDDSLFLDGPGDRSIAIDNFFGEGKIESFLFREGLFTAEQVAGSAAQATAEEQAALKERLPGDERSAQDDGSSRASKVSTG